MRLIRALFSLAAMCIVCAEVAASQTSLHGYSKNGFSRTFLDARASDQPPRYKRTEIKRMIRDAKTTEDFERLADYFDFQSLEFEQKANQEVKELERLLVIRFHPRTYATQVEYTRELIRKYRSKADECYGRANAYRASIER
ncbi:hypothetical protein P8935_11335 [Telmatobacter sp. DSM 110680]|uniref:RxLR effector protein n=1 Tax=Telmatobacter sp. DSM 110680 TaxID=3036704 RepID=A0AAU7DRI6_9BACT